MNALGCLRLIQKAGPQQNDSAYRALENATSQREYNEPIASGAAKCPSYAEFGVTVTMPRIGLCGFGLG